MAVTELEMRFDSHAALQREFQSNLRSGRAFILGSVDADVLADVTLSLVHPVSGECLRLPARVVMVSNTPPLLGAGIELQKFSADVAKAIEDFVASAVEAPAAAPVEEVGAEDVLSLDAPGVDDAVADLSLELGSEDVVSDDDVIDADADAVPLSLDDDAVESDDDVLDVSADEVAEVDLDEVTEVDPNNPKVSKRPPKDPSVRPPANALEKVRRLTVPEQMKLARNGEQADRIALERIAGKPVWEALLQNPRITIPEVARIARMGTAPRTLVEFIAGNNTWIAAPPIRRALLTNPKLNEEGALKLLRLMPKQELKLVGKQMSYSPIVRAAAKKLTGAD